MGFTPDCRMSFNSELNWSKLLLRTFTAQVYLSLSLRDTKRSYSSENSSESSDSSVVGLKWRQGCDDEPMHVNPSERNNDNSLWTFYCERIYKIDFENESNLFRSHSKLLFYWMTSVASIYVSRFNLCAIVISHVSADKKPRRRNCPAIKPPHNLHLPCRISTH